MRDAAVKAGWIDERGVPNGTYVIVERLPHLSRIQIELAVKCNFACVYCYSESGPTRSDALDVPEVRRLLTEANELGVVAVDFTGGEVLIYKGWQDVILHARSLGMVVSVHTNGLLLTERNVDFLRRAGVRSLQVTVESHHADVHESVGRGTRVSHTRVIEGVRRAKEAGLNIRLAALVHRKNIDHIGESARWFYREFKTPISLDRVIATGVPGASSLAVSESEFWEAVAPLLGIGAASADRICDTSAPTAHGAIEPECGVAHSFVYITADGYISLCPTMTHREDGRFSGPNLRETTLERAWYESELFTLYRGINCENTSVCPAAAACGGGCRSNAYTTTGRLTAPDVISCNTFKNPDRTFVDFLGRYADGEFLPISSRDATL
ncbi:MAG: radical SAM protein [Leifsonia sp.]